MNGVEYIKSLGDDTKGTKSELIKEAKAKGFKSCVYSISLGVVISRDQNVQDTKADYESMLQANTLGYVEFPEFIKKGIFCLPDKLFKSMHCVGILGGLL
jgi:hypothetical protein